MEHIGSEDFFINNIKSCEHFSYPVILLHGTIKHPDNNCQILLKPPASAITVIRNGQFKILLRLNPGENELQIEHQLANIQLKVHYEARKTELTVVPLYVVFEGHDGRFQAPETEDNSVESACSRITLGMELMRCFMAEKLSKRKLGRKTFHLECDCSVFKSKLRYSEARKLKPKDLWLFLGREIMASSLSSGNRKFMAFVSCTFYDGSRFSKNMQTYSDFVGLTEGYVALGAGGLALCGTACLYTWPENLEEVFEKFENCALVDRKKFMDDSSYRGTVGACFSTTLGSALHELCHSFDLGHSEIGIMGREFGNVYQFFTIDTDENSTTNRTLSIYEDYSYKIGRSKETDWTENCAVLLSYHKWLNYHNYSRKYILQFDTKSGFIKSTAGIRVIEVRNLNNDEMVMAYWTFTHKVLKYSFCLPGEILASKYDKVVVVEDDAGNILKEIIS